MNYELLLRCVQHVTALQLSSLGGVNPELIALADELNSLLAPVAEEAPAEEAPAEEAPAEEAPAEEVPANE